MPEKWVLRQLQALPLIVKVRKTQLRIREFYEHFNGNVCVSFSGGKDSTVLAHLVKEMYPDVPLVFADTGLEYPEIRQFARKMGAEFVRPKMMFDQVISEYGYPIISKEVAEAIHYARRIRKTNYDTDVENLRDGIPNGEKTAEYYKRMITGQPGISKTGEILMGGYTENKAYRTQTVGFDRYKNVRTVHQIKRKLPHRIERRKNLQWGGGSERNGLEGNRRGKLAGVGETGGKSMYNKSKWLPLCLDTDFKISHKCCSAMKKGPMQMYQRKTKRKPFIGTLTEESLLREQAWIKHGCNAFDSKKPSSQPLSFWTEQDILKYLYMEGWEIASVYGDIVGVDDYGMEYEPLPGVDCKLKCSKCQRTGCIFCGFGAYLDKGKGSKTRFQRLAFTHPKQYEYCIGGGQWVDNPDYDRSAPVFDGEWRNWNPKKIWVPSKKGLGMGKVFDECNAIYGKDFIKYD